MLDVTSLKPGRPLLLLLLGGLVLRAAVVASTTGLEPRIVDEQHYHILATSLVEGRGFAWASGPTSLRPPLYPALVAALWEATGTRSLTPVRAVQAVLGVATIWLTYLLGRRLFTERAALVAAAIVAVYPALLFATALLLTETLFTFLLTGFAVAVLALIDRPRPGMAILAGALLGLAALTRSIVWPFPLVMAPLLLWFVDGRSTRKVALTAAFVASFAAVLTPWAIRNTRLQGATVIVDTMGGLNLRMGNYEHTPHDRIWDAVSMKGEKSWIVGLPPRSPSGEQWTEGQKERWARDQAVTYMRRHPGLTLWRSMIKAGDFFALDRDFIAGIDRGLFSPPAVLAVPIAGLMLVAFPLLALAALAGIFLAPPGDWRAHVVLIVLVLFVAGLHAIVFGHPRYRLPLTPIFAVFAGGAVAARAWRVGAAPRGAVMAAALVSALLVGTWIAQFVVRDWPRLSRFVGVS